MSPITNQSPAGRAQRSFADQLQQLAIVLAQDVSDDSRFAIGVRPDGDEVELHLHPLVTDDVMSELASFVAPPEWRAFGVATGGSAHLTDQPDGTRHRVRVVVLVDRLGRVISAITGDDSSAGVSSGPGRHDSLAASTDIAELSQGRVPDACRRVLGLPTAPPPLPPTDLLIMQWLDALTEASTQHPGTIGWDHAAELLPEFVGASWAELRGRASDEGVHIRDVAPHVAAWMDDGMFAREALSAYPPVSLLLCILMETLPTDTMSRTLDTVETLAAWTDAIHDHE